MLHLCATTAACIRGHEPSDDFKDLENSASSDAIIREKIARLPPELSEASHLESLQTFEDGQKLLVKVRFIPEIISKTGPVQ